MNPITTIPKVSACKKHAYYHILSALHAAPDGLIYEELEFQLERLVPRNSLRIRFNELKERNWVKTDVIKRDNRSHRACRVYFIEHNPMKRLPLTIEFTTMPLVTDNQVNNIIRLLKKNGLNKETLRGAIQESLMGVDMIKIPQEDACGLTK